MLAGSINTRIDVLSGHLLMLVLGSFIFNLMGTFIIGGFIPMAGVIAIVDDQHLR